MDYYLLAQMVNCNVFGIGIGLAEVQASLLRRQIKFPPEKVDVEMVLILC